MSRSRRRVSVLPVGLRTIRVHRRIKKTKLSCFRRRGPVHGIRSSARRGPQVPPEQRGAFLGGLRQVLRVRIVPRPRLPAEKTHRSQVSDGSDRTSNATPRKAEKSFVIPFTSNQKLICFGRVPAFRTSHAAQYRICRGNQVRTSTETAVALLNINCQCTFPGSSCLITRRRIDLSNGAKTYTPNLIIHDGNIR